MNHDIIYVVDDDNNVLRSLKWLFESIHVEAKTYTSALDFLGNYHPADRGFLITDVRMPGMDGLELLGKLKAQHSLLRVIIITGFGDIPMAISAIKAGAIDFITKPLNEQGLLELIQTCLKFYPNYPKKIIDKSQLLTENELQALELVWKGH